MNPAIFTKEVQNFIKENKDADPIPLLLKKQLFNQVDQKELVEQLQCVQKCKSKLPTWFETENIYYPHPLNIEQTSSELTAAYKAEQLSGDNLIDLTGGFGVDTFYLSKRFKRTTHCETNLELSQIAKHNLSILGATTIDFQPTDGLSFLKNSPTNFSWGYIDPSRRNAKKGKVVQLADYEPNILEHLDLILSKCNNLLVKTSPLLDLTLGVKLLKGVREIHVVAVQNEVKELLWFIQQDFTEEPLITAVNMGPKGKESLSFKKSEEQALITQYAPPLVYLYEPNAALLKSGAFKCVAKRYGLFKLAEHTHLYTSNERRKFAGRVFKIEACLPFSKKTLKDLGMGKANINTRNFPRTVEDLRKQFKIRDGGDDYLFFTTSQGTKKHLVHAKKIA